MEERGNERWSAAIANLSEISNNLDSLENLLIKKAVYVDEDTFNKASLTSDQARTIKVFFVFLHNSLPDHNNFLNNLLVKFEINFIYGLPMHH